MIRTQESFELLASWIQAALDARNVDDSLAMFRR